LVRAMSRTPDVRASGAEHYPRIPAPLGWGAVNMVIKNYFLASMQSIVSSKD
jgi:hypothetical protein